MKNILTITIIIVFAISSFAQKFSGGLMIGPTIGWLKADEKSVVKQGSRLSYTWGAFIDKNLGENFALSTGIYVNEVGGKLQFSDSLFFKYEDIDGLIQKNSIINFKNRYVEVPISLKGMTNEIGNLKYHLKIGLSPMIKWKAKADIETLDINSTVVTYKNVNITEEVNAFNLAFHVGGGAQFLLGGNTSIIGEVIYYNGIVDVTPNDDARINKYNILSHQIMVRVGIKF